VSKNCDKETLLQYESHVIDDIVEKVPNLATLFLDEVNGGQLSEAQLDEAGIPLVPNDDRRTMDKDQRSQSHQRAVMLSNHSSRQRRKEWKDRGRNKSDLIIQEGDHTILGALDNIGVVGKKRKKRAPNRSKEVIEEEKRMQQLARIVKAQARDLKNSLSYESCDEIM